MHTLKVTRCGTFSQCKSSRMMRDRPRSNFRVPEITRAAAWGPAVACRSSISSRWRTVHCHSRYGWSQTHWPMSLRFHWSFAQNVTRIYSFDVKIETGFRLFVQIWCNSHWMLQFTCSTFAKSTTTETKSSAFILSNHLTFHQVIKSLAVHARTAGCFDACGGHCAWYVTIQDSFTRNKQVSAAVDIPTVLYTDVDGQYDKLVTDDRHQFITLTFHLSWQHLRRSIDTCSRSRDMVGEDQNLNGSLDLTTPLSGMVCHPWASTCYDQPI